MYRLLSVGLLCAAALLPAGCQDKKTTAPLGASAGTANRKTYPREEFEKMVKGKSAQEVVAALGQPDYKVQTVPKEEWKYAYITTNGDKKDAWAQLNFDGGHVATVTYAE